MSEPLRVLVLEDRPEDADLMLHELRKSDFDPTWERVESEPEFLGHLAPELDLILADYALPQFDALRALGLLKESGLDIPFIVVTGSISEEAAVSVMRQGASDYLLKDRLTRLGPAVVGAIEQKRLRDEKRRTDITLNENERLYRILFQNAPIGLGLLDAEGRILALNEAILSAAGYSFEEASQLRDVAAFFEDPATAQRILHVFQQKGSIRQGYARLKRKDGVGYDTLLTLTAVVLGGRQCLQLMVEDITEHKRAEEALAASEKRFRVAAESLVDIIYEWDLKQKVDWYGDIDGIMGYPTGGFPRTLDGWAATLHPEDKERVLAAVDGQLKGMAPYDVEYRVRKGDGEWRWWSARGTALRDERDEPYRFIGSITDITERVRAEEVLRESENWLRAIVEGTHALLVSVDANGHFTYANDATAKAVGYASPNELIGKSYLHFIDPEDRQQVLATFINQANTRKLSSMQEFRIIDTEGKGKWFSFVSSLVIKDGQVVGQSGVAQDITERKRAEDALREGEERYRMITENMADTIWMMDMNMRPTFISPSVVKARGYTLEELQQIPFERQFPPESLERAIQTTAQQLTPENLARPNLRLPSTLELEFYRKDGSTFWSEVTITLVRDSEGRPTGMLGVGRDITKRKRSEEALRASEERFRLLAENANDLIYRFRLTPPRGFEYVSPSAIRILGYTPEELYADPDLGVKMVVPEDRQVLEAATRTPEAFTRPLVLRWQRKDGTIAWIEQRSQPVHGRDSQLIAIQGIARDITERKLAEDEVRRRAAYLEALNAVIEAAATAPDLPRLLNASLGQVLKAMGLDQGAIFVHGCLVSRGFPDVMLQELKNLLPTHTLAMTNQALMTVEDWQQPPPGPLERMAAVFRRIGVNATFAVAITTESETVGAIAVASPAPHPWSSEAVVLLEGIARQLGNATEKLYLIQQTKAQASQLQHIIDTVPEGILSVDQDRKVALANPLARECLETLAQYGESENLLGLAGRPLSELLRPRSDGLPHEVVVPGPRPRIFEIRSSPAELAPASEQQTLILHEVTEQHEMRTAAEHQERLAAIGQLAAGIAHDFNNIIGAIILHSELMLAEPGLSEKGLMRQKMILQQAHRAASLTQQVLDFSRRAVLELRPMDLAPFVKETLKLLQRTLPESVQVSLSIEPGEYTIRADPARIQQVFMNLALNARDAMPGGGQLRFELSHMRAEPGRSLPFSDMAAGEWLVAKVDDTGTGVSPDSLPHIFEPFFTTKPQGEGTGLGLSQVFGIVKQHGGFIDVGSRIGEGTTFTIYLPALTRGEAIVAEAQVTGAPRGNGETILVVEDHASIRVAVCEILESLNYHTLQAANGEEALAVFEQHADRIDLVVSDLVMPEMGGQALYGALRQRRPDLKLILMTGYPLGGATRELLDDQEVSWLQKPMSTLGLAEAVHRALFGEGA